MLLHTGRVLSETAGIHHPPVTITTNRLSVNTDNKAAANDAQEDGDPAWKDYQV